MRDAMPSITTPNSEWREGNERSTDLFSLDHELIELIGFLANLLCPFPRQEKRECATVKNLSPLNSGLEIGSSQSRSVLGNSRRSGNHHKVCLIHQLINRIESGAIDSVARNTRRCP